MEKNGNNFVQPELNLNFEGIKKDIENSINDKSGLDENDEAQIPTYEELEKLKETDFEEYLLWIERITNSELEKHKRESEEIARQEEIRLKEIDDNLYKDNTPEDRNRSQLYGQR